MQDTAKVAFYKVLFAILLSVLAAGIVYVVYVAMRGAQEILALGIPAATIGVALCWLIWIYGVRDRHM